MVGQTHETRFHCPLTSSSTQGGIWTRHALLLRQLQVEHTRTAEGRGESSHRPAFDGLAGYGFPRCGVQPLHGEVSGGIVQVEYKLSQVPTLKNFYFG